MEISTYLIAAGLGWLVAQLLKYILWIIKSGDWLHVKTILRSGNMPSVHTATVVALTIVVGLKDGVESGLFAVSLLFALIVTYDAMGVRRSTGEQGLALKKLIKIQDKKIAFPYLALGHQPLEVAVGAIIGVGTGIIVAFFTSNL